MKKEGNGTTDGQMLLLLTLNHIQVAENIKECHFSSTMAQKMCLFLEMIEQKLGLYTVIQKKTNQDKKKFLI